MGAATVTGIMVDRGVEGGRVSGKLQTSYLHALLKYSKNDFVLFWIFVHSPAKQKNDNISLPCTSFREMCFYIKKMKWKGFNITATENFRFYLAYPLMH